MANKPTISVVIPIYNVGKYLEECVRSAMNQTFKDIEIICVNDGSTDNSLEILKKLAKEDSRIKIIDKPNAGYGHTMNVGIKAATGKYLAILESDDYIDLHMYEDLYNIIEKNKVDFVVSNYYSLYNSESKNRVVKKSNVFKDESLYNRVLDPKSGIFFYYFTVYNWTGLYNLAFLRKNNVLHNETPGASYQDTGFNFFVYTSAKSCVFTDKAYYYYRQDNPNASMRNKAKVYSVVHEYDYIKDKLVKKGTWDKNKGIYTHKKYDGYLHFNYSRISHIYKKEFLEFMSNDFKKAIKNKEFQEEYFMDIEKKVFKQIANKPTEFYCDNLIWRIDVHKNVLNDLNYKIETKKNSKVYKLARFLTNSTVKK